MIKSVLGGLAAAVLAMGLAAPSAKAAVIYDFTGTCGFGCTGQATAVLELADSYTPGEVLRNSDFLSFSYSSSTDLFSIPADAFFTGFFGAARLPVVSGTASFGLNAGFGTAVNTGSGWSAFFSPSDIDEGGSAYTWTLRQPTQLAAPGPLSLLALGLAGLALAGRRRKHRA